MSALFVQDSESGDRCRTWNDIIREGQEKGAQAELIHRAAGSLPGSVSTWLLLLVGLGLLKLMHADTATLFSCLIEALHLKADSRIIHALVLKVAALQPHSVLVARLVGLVIVRYLIGR